MIKNVVQKDKVYNPEKENCPVCSVLNSIYRTNSFQKEMEIPEEVGKGYFKRIIVKPSMEIAISDLTFYERLTMADEQDNSFYSLAFCLGEPLQWRVEGNKKDYEIGYGESYIFNGKQGTSICSFNPGQRFWGISIQLDYEIITSFVHHMEKKDSCNKLSYGGSFFYKKEFSSTIKMILNEIINCRYRDIVKRIYLEGKILELVAIYMDEIILENGGMKSSIKLSLSDVKLLHKARSILEKNIISPPTIRKLSRMVSLNEYKLKKGFKELFGMPVYTYVIDKRMEMALFLLKNKKLSVTETALRIGYSDASHFAEKFRKKYGVNPSEYIQNL